MFYEKLCQVEARTNINANDTLHNYCILNDIIILVSELGFIKSLWLYLNKDIKMT